MRGIKPISPGCFNYFLMRICSFRKFTHDNGRPEPFTLSRARPCGGHAWPGPAAPTPGMGSSDPGCHEPPSRREQGKLTKNTRGGPFFCHSLCCNPRCCVGGAMSKILSGWLQWVSGCCAAAAPRGGHGPEPPGKAPGIAASTGGENYGGAGMLVLGMTPSLRGNCPLARDHGGMQTPALERQQPPLIFRWPLGKAAQSRIIGSLSALCRRDTPPLRLALTTLYAIDFSFSKAGIKQGRNGGSTTNCVSAVLCPGAAGTGGNRAGASVGVASGQEPGLVTFCHISFFLALVCPAPRTPWQCARALAVRFDRWLSVCLLLGACGRWGGETRTGQVFH